MTRVLLVDDEAAVIECLRAILEGAPDIEVVGEAWSGEEAVNLVDQVDPEVVVMDVAMPGIGGVEAIRRIASRPPPRPGVVALTNLATDDTAVEALRAGAGAFVAKVSAPAELFEAIRVVAKGEATVAPGMLKALLDRHFVGQVPSASPALCSPREREVLEAIGTGADNAQIARRLYMAEPTVRTHVQHLRSKLGARSRAQLVVRAWEMGLLKPR